MHYIDAVNVNDAYRRGLQLLRLVGERSPSRAGAVLVAPGPVTTRYRYPTERVLFDHARDANPFFHLMEGLWMLAGRDDAAFLNRYVADFGRRFAEEDGRVHGAYGHRWRHALGLDQLDAAVTKLRANPDDRQVVLQMWDARQGLYGGHYGEGPEEVGCDDLTGTWRDRPCNTHCYLRVREDRSRKVNSLHGAMTNTNWHHPHLLDLTVCCRSNDIVWGAYGSNAVHFSMLQEYLAGRIGVDVGHMYVLSNNYHGYVDVLDQLPLPDVDRIYGLAAATMPMGSSWEHWDEDLRSFMGFHDILWSDDHLDLVGRGSSYVNEWFQTVAENVAISNYFRVRGDLLTAMRYAREIQATDWQLVCHAWLWRRAMRRAAISEVRSS